MAARIRAVLRRRDSRREGPHRLGELFIDPSRREVRVGDREVHFANKSDYCFHAKAEAKATSQRDDQVADLGGLGEEWVVAGVEFHDAGCSTGELALQVGRGAPVLRADQVRRGHVLPGR